MPDQNPVVANELIAQLHAFATRVGEALAANKASASSDLEDALLDLKNEILGGASTALDTLKEIEDILKSNTEVDSALQALRVVNYDRSQSLTSTQQGTARTNIGAAADAEVVKHSASQGLTTTQQGNARTNIGAASNADLTTLAGRVTTNEGDISSHGTRLTTAEGDIDALEALIGDGTDMDFVGTFNEAYEPAPASSGD